MRIAILDDYQDAFRSHPKFDALAGHEVTAFTDTLKDPEALAERLAPFDAVVMIQQRSPLPGSVISRLPNLKFISQTGRNTYHLDLAACARQGITATVFWPGLGYLPVTELVLRRLLPLAREGLDAWEVDPAERDRLLKIVEQRCLTGRNGATWQADSLHLLEDDHHMARPDALRALLQRYIPLMHENTPVHEWPLD